MKFTFPGYVNEAPIAKLPRLLIAAPASGTGKTTLVAALAGALRARGLRVAVFKCGPDYLDPSYHALVTGAPCHNLDGWLMGRAAVQDTFGRAAADADVALIEGVMGLFDGAQPDSEVGSAAEMAKWLAAPVVLAVDASGMSRSLAALAQGFARFDPLVNVVGVVANRVGSRSHLALLGRALQASAEPGGLLLLGGLPRQEALTFGHRHLGLHTAQPEDATKLAQWAELAEQWLDVDGLLALAGQAPPLLRPAPDTAPAAPEPEKLPRCRIGVAWDKAFHFYYEDNLNRLRACGAELVPFSPLVDATLPTVDGLLFGGGYPELYAAELSANRSMLQAVNAFASSGRPVYGECGGLMYLSRAIHTLDGQRFPMVGLVAGEAHMQSRLQALGYVEVCTTVDTPLGPAGLSFRGHQFRYSEWVADALPAGSRYQVRRQRDGSTWAEGYGLDNVLASYVHAHWASCPQAAQGLVAACNRWAEAQATPSPQIIPKTQVAP